MKITIKIWENMFLNLISSEIILFCVQEEKCIWNFVPKRINYQDALVVRYGYSNFIED